jgi:hypothetical protein
MPSFIAKIPYQNLVVCFVIPRHEADVEAEPKGDVMFPDGPSAFDQEQEVTRRETVGGIDNTLMADGQTFFPLLSNDDQDKGGIRVFRRGGETGVVTGDETGEALVNRFEGGNTVQLEPDREPVLEGAPQPLNIALGLALPNASLLCSGYISSPYFTPGVQFFLLFL